MDVENSDKEPDCLGAPSLGPKESKITLIKLFLQLSRKSIAD
jgi:hypothetical protein